MSYILDALKRADAERQRGTVPGLHVQQLSQPMGNAGEGPRWRGWWWIAGAAMAMLVFALAYRGFDTSAPTAAGALAVPLTAAQAPVVASAPSVPQAVAPNVTHPGAEQLPFVAPSPAKQKPVLAASANPLPKQEIPASLARTVASAPAEPLKLSELPEDIRRQIPALAVSGSVYSDNPTRRLLVVNGQVQEQGGQVSAGLKLEEIGEKSSVFSYSGMRFKVSY